MLRAWSTLALLLLTLLVVLGYAVVIYSDVAEALVTLASFAVFSFVNLVLYFVEDKQMIVKLLGHGRYAVAALLLLVIVLGIVFIINPLDEDDSPSSAASGTTAVSPQSTSTTPPTVTATPTLTPPSPGPIEATVQGTPRAWTLVLRYPETGRLTVQVLSSLENVDLSPLEFRWVDDSGNEQRLALSAFAELHQLPLGAMPSHYCIQLFVTSASDQEPGCGYNNLFPIVVAPSQRFWVLGSGVFGVWYGDQRLGACSTQLKDCNIPS